VTTVVVIAVVAVAVAAAAAAASTVVAAAAAAEEMTASRKAAQYVTYFLRILDLIPHMTINSTGSLHYSGPRNFSQVSLILSSLYS
jgi:hypothetical protein